MEEEKRDEEETKAVVRTLKARMRWHGVGAVEAALGSTNLRLLLRYHP